MEQAPGMHGTNYRTAWSLAPEYSEEKPNKTERMFFMTTAPAELMKEYVNSQQFKSTADIMDAMKEMFRDVLQQVMESELETELGYEKS